MLIIFGYARDMAKKVRVPYSNPVPNYTHCSPFSISSSSSSCCPDLPLLFSSLSLSLSLLLFLLLLSGIQKFSSDSKFAMCGYLSICVWLRSICEFMCVFVSGGNLIFWFTFSFNGLGSPSTLLSLRFSVVLVVFSLFCFYYYCCCCCCCCCWQHPHQQQT